MMRGGPAKALLGLARSELLEDLGHVATNAQV